MLVEVSGQKFVFPQLCACCCRSPDTTLNAAHSKSWGKRVVHTKTWSWNFPYCSSCLDHIRSYDYASVIGVIFAVIAVVVGAMIGSAAGWSEDAKAYGIPLVIVIAIVAGILGYVRQERKAQAMRVATCACAGRGIAYVNWYGTVHSFDIVSSNYAGLFMTANAKKLVNVTEYGRRLMEAAAINLLPAEPIMRIAVSASAAFGAAPPSNKNESPDDDQLVRCLMKLESLKGTASRRATLDLALKAVHSDEVKQRLRFEAARIEVMAVLDKVDDLKTESAKKRHLMLALEEIRSDGLDDATQLKLIEMLEAALRDVEASKA